LGFYAYYLVIYIMYLHLFRKSMQNPSRVPRRDTA
jgi:hypothetical protein